MPNIAVLMAVYNGEEWLKAQLDSIFNQYGVNVHIYASDDLSNDGSYNFLTNLSKVDSRLTVLPHAGRFGSAGANFLRLLKDVDISKFDYVAFSDQDDIWLEKKLFRAFTIIKTKVVDGYSGNVTAYWTDGKHELICKSEPQQQYDYMFESAGPGCSFVFTQKLAVELQRFLTLNQGKCREVALHDWLTYAYARSRMYKWFIDSEPYVLYRQHQKNVLGANFGFKAKVMRWRKMREGWHRNQALILGDLLGYEKKFPITALQSYQFLARFRLILNVRKLRRSFRDAVALALFFMVTSKK